MNFVLYLVVYLHYACRPLYTSNIKKAYERLLFFFFSAAFLAAIRSNHVISGTKKKGKVPAIVQVMLSFTPRSDNEYIKVVRERITSSPSAFSVGGV